MSWTGIIDACNFIRYNYILFVIFLFNSFDTNKVIETKTEKQKEIKEKICFMDNELKVIAENKKEKDKALKVLQE